MNIAVLGAGMVGRVIANDLSKNHQVTSFDINENNLILLNQFPGITCKQADLSTYDSYTGMLTGFDMVVSAVPGFMGYKTLESIIKAGKDVVDISFFPENALELHLAPFTSSAAGFAGANAIRPIGDRDRPGSRRR